MAVLSHEGTYPIMYGGAPIPIGAGHRNGYLARPDYAGRFPVVIVLPGLEGMGSFEKDLCRRLARMGVASLTLGLHHGDDPLDAYNDLPDTRALGDLDEVHEFISSEDVDWNQGTRLGLLGIDVGGRFALMKATESPWVASVAVAYTPLAGDEDRQLQVADSLDHLAVPVLGLYGASDEFVDSSSVDEAQRRNEAGQWLLYEGMGHGFLDPEQPTFDQGAADDGFARLVAFFIATLPAAEPIDLG